MKKAVKIPLIVLGSILVLLLIALLLVSPIVKNYIEKHDKELIGREVSIEKLRVNLLTGKVTVNDLTVYEDDGTTPFTTFDELEMKVKVFDLFRNRLWVKHGRLSGLKINVEQDRTWFNFNSILEHFASDESSSEESSGIGVVLNDFEIERSVFHYTDLAVGSEFQLRNIAVRIPFVDLSDLKTNVGLDLNFADNATLHTDLKLSDNAKEYCINLKLKNLGVDVIEPYLKQSLAVDSLQGRFSMDATVKGRTEHILDFDLTGDMAFDQLSCQGDQGNQLGYIDSIRIKINRFNLNDNILELKSMHLSGLNTTYIVNSDGSTNYDLFQGYQHHNDTTVFEKVIDTVTSQIDEVQETKPFRISINELVMDGSCIVYQNNTLPEPFDYEISDINVQSNHFTLDGNNTVKIDAQLNKTGKIHVYWHGDFSGLDNHDLTLNLSNVKCVDFSPYCLKFFGFPLKNGTLSFLSQNKVVNGKLEGINKLQIASPEVGRKRRDIEPRYDIPLKFGFFLLTDKHNNVNLDLPVSGNLRDPKFSYRRTLMKAFTDMLIKVVTSPFRFLESDDDIQYIMFDPLQPDFSPAEYIMIDNVASTLYSQPNLNIILEGKVNYDETIQRLCNLQLQRDYYLSQHPEIDPASIDFLTNEAIRSIKLNDKGLCEFAVQYSEKERLRSKKDVASVAYEVYHKKSEVMLPKLLADHNALLSNYLLNVKGLSPEQVSVISIDKSLLKSFNKSSRYDLHVLVYEDITEP